MAANPFAAAPAAGGLFGTPAPAPAAAGGLFGTPAPAPACGTSLFGGAATPAAPATSLFGATTPAKPAGTGLFGAPAPATGTSLFGAPATPATGTGLFGAPAPAATPGGGLFGLATPAAGGGLFGAPTPSAPTPAAAAPPAVQDQDIFNQFLQQMETAYNAGKPQQCSFKHVFYDDLTQPDGKPPTPEEMARKRQEAQAQADPALWERADARNPDPSRFCPVQVTGFENLLKRQQKQEEMAELLAQHLEKEVAEPLRQIAAERKVSIDMRLRHYRARQQLLAHRTLTLIAKLEAQQHMRTHQGADPPQSDEERKWGHALRQLTQELRDPEHGRPKLLELASTHRLSAFANGSRPNGAPLDGAHAASRINADAVQEWLGTHQAGLAKLVEVQNELVEDLAVLQNVSV